jgi:hypothetical protein
VTQSEARAIPISQQVLNEGNILVSEGKRFEIEEIRITRDLDGKRAENDILVIILATISADNSECFRGSEFKFVVDGTDYEASTDWMNKFKPLVGQRDYPGWNFGHCVSAGEAEPTFLVFDVRMKGAGPILTFLTDAVNLGDWATVSGIRGSAPTSSLETTATTTVTLAPSATQTPPTEDYTATGNANVRSCPKTTCEIVRGVSLGERLTKVGEAQGDTVNGSSLWYEVSFANGATGFIHSGLARAGTPRPAPVVQQPRATTAPNQAAPTSVDNTQPNVLPTIPQSTAAPSSQFTCGGDFYNCSDFSNRTELMAYFNACPGDPSRLDADNDGIPCESLR